MKALVDDRIWDDERRAVGQTLCSWRVRRRLSQLQLAVHAEISQRHLSFIESGRAQPSRAMLLRVAEQLQVPLLSAELVLEAFFPEDAVTSSALAQLPAG